MKKIFNSVTNIILLILLLVISIACHQQTQQKENHYDLEIISDISDYEKSVAENSDKALVDIEKLIPGINLDIRYATQNNFTKQQVYLSPKAFVRKPVADALLKIQNELNNKGFALKIFDAYRPYAAKVKFYEVYPDTNFVAAPWRGSVHNRGCAVDVTLIDLESNSQLEMPTLFDDFTEKAAHSYMDLSEQALENRQLLRGIMMKYGFTQYDHEWWHYNFKGWEEYELMDVSFEELK